MDASGPGWGADKIFGSLFMGDAQMRPERGCSVRKVHSKFHISSGVSQSSQRSDVAPIQRLFSYSI